MDIIKIFGNQIQIDTQNSTYLMHNENGVLCHLYYGKKLPDCDHTYFAKRYAYNSDIQSYIGENVPTLENALLEYPVFGEGGIVSPATEILNSDGSNFADLRIKDYVIHNGKPKIDGLPSSYAEEGDNVQTLEVKTIDIVSHIAII